MRIWGGVVLSFWCTALAWGQSPKILHTVTFRTEPRSGVTVLVDGSSYSTADPVVMDYTYDAEKALVLRRDGFRDQPVTLTAQQAAEGHFPPDSQAALRLHAISPWTGGLAWLQEHPYQGLGAFALLGLALPAALYRGWASWRHQRQLQLRMKQIDERRDRSDSVILSRIEGYVLVELLGQGGMAAVYKAVPADTMDEDQAVAIKLISRQLFHEPEFVKRFQREVSAYQKLAHPNIVRVVSWRELDGSEEPPYIILELVAGQTLGRAIPATGMTWMTGRPMLEQIFLAVAFAHRQGVVHRDLKPDNIMVDAGRIKVMDFGLARSHDASHLTATGTVLGTPAYMAPEQLSQGAAGPAVDQYALGAVAYRMLSGRLPHEAEDMMALFHKVLSADPVDLRVYRPDLPQTIVAVVMRMLARDPNARFDSVAEAWQAFPA